MAENEEPEEHVEWEEPVDAGAEVGEQGAPTLEAAIAPAGDQDVVEQEVIVSNVGLEINTTSFEEFRLDPSAVEQAQNVWRSFVSLEGTREAAGQAIYGAVFESAPNLQSLFVSPRAVAAMKFFEGINTLVAALDDPAALKVKVETLCFGHMSLEVSVPRVTLIRDAILDLFQVELGPKVTSQAYKTWLMLLNYVGGAIIFIKSHYAERLRILEDSWKLVASDDQDDLVELQAKEEVDEVAAEATEAAKGEDGEKKKQTESQKMVQKVPTNFHDMYLFNAAVMGFSSATWMHEILACFDNMVRNVSNPNRFQEECDVCILRISKVTTGPVKLADYKSCMLASLRSLLPRDWTTQHELAWVWLWESIERLLYSTMGKPTHWEKALSRFLGSMEEDQAFEFRAAIYAKFFAACPAGQDFFKQSNTYLHTMAAKIMNMTLDMYKEPVRMTDDISALGLRHVGYGIPTEYFGPWAGVWLEVLQNYTEDETLIQSMRWSLGLITKSLVRTILEGSTIVMKAINVNSRNHLNRAIACAPRGERSGWMLKVQVGTQNISPLDWAINSGALEAASAMIQDLVTIRADRDRYYCGIYSMFTRHPDLVKKLIDNAPSLLPELFSGLIWRSRLTFNGMRRVNYYLEHLLVDSEGAFHKTLEWIVDMKDPNIVTHPCLALVTDVVWVSVACRQFLLRKLWFMFTVGLFLTSQAVLNHVENPTETDRIVVFTLRMLIYVLSFGSMFGIHVAKSFVSIRNKDTLTVLNTFSFPGYLRNWQELCNLLLVCCLLVMLATEPILACAAQPDALPFGDDCEAGRALKRFPYGTFAMFSMMLYCVLLIDLAVFSNAVTAHVLVCGRMISELGLCLSLGLGVCLMFSTALSCIHQKIEAFQGIPIGMQSLVEMFLNMFSASNYQDLRSDVLVVMGNWCFLISMTLFLGNMLVAQLTCAYGTIYADMVGYARLKRMSTIIESMAGVSSTRWHRFVESMKFEEKLEFNEGDLGLAGGIATTEVASAHPTNVDSIRRYGGSTSPTIQWPDETNQDDDSERWDRMERHIQAAMKKSKGDKRKKGGAAQQSASGASGSGEDHGEE